MMILLMQCKPSPMQKKGNFAIKMYIFFWKIHHFCSFNRINAVMGHVQTMYLFPSLITKVQINILSITHIAGSSYKPDDLDQGLDFYLHT